MDPQTLKKLNQARLSREGAVVVTELDSGRDRVVLETDAVEGELGDHVRQAFRIIGKIAVNENYNVWT